MEWEKRALTLGLKWGRGTRQGSFCAAAVLLVVKCFLFFYDLVSNAAVRGCMYAPFYPKVGVSLVRVKITASLLRGRRE